MAHRFRMELSGHPVIDRQHKSLFDLLDGVEKWVGVPNNEEGILAAMTGLIDYTKSHFGYEEVFMQEANYPDYAKHKERHARFVRQLDHLYPKVIANQMTIDDMMVIIEGWLVDHINTEAPLFRKHIDKTIMR